GLVMPVRSTLLWLAPAIQRAGALVQRMPSRHDYGPSSRNAVSMLWSLVPGSSVILPPACSGGSIVALSPTKPISSSCNQVLTISVSSALSSNARQIFRQSSIVCDSVGSVSLFLTQRYREITCNGTGSIIPARPIANSQWSWPLKSLGTKEL